MSTDNINRTDFLRLMGMAVLPIGGSAGAESHGTWSESALKALHHSSLMDRVVIITGSSRGFGWFMAQELLRAGARVTLTGRNSDTLATVLDEAHSIAGPDQCIAVAGDVTRPEECAQTVEETVRAFGRIDVLINNAGRSCRCKMRSSP